MPPITRTAAPAPSTALPGAAVDDPRTPAELASAPPFPRKRAWLIAAFGLFAALVIVIEAPGPVRAVIVLTAWLLVPGWALIRHVPIRDQAARVALVVVSSGTIAALASLVMVWTQWWHPLPVAVTVLVVASVSLLIPAPSGPARQSAAPRPVASRSFRLAHHWPWAVLGVAVTLWLSSLAGTSTDDLGQWGLLPEFPVTWYIGVGLAAALCIGSVVRFRFRSGLMSTAVASLVVMLYGSAGFVEEAPRLPWSYKHIAVTSYIDANGAVNPELDVYNRWPGFFSTSAFMGQAIGYPNPVDYAAWAEVGFALIGVVLVLAIARVFSRDSRWVWTVALVFIVGNWVGQNYYAPQAFAFTLYLALCLIAMTVLQAKPTAPVAWLERVLGSPRSRRRTSAVPSLDSAWGSGEVVYSRGVRVSAIVAIVVLDFVIVATHQLTPYFAILTLLPLFVLGYLRPWWLGLSLVVIPVLYLLPNFDYIQNEFGLFSNIDPVANATYTAYDNAPVTEGSQFHADGVRLLVASVVGLAAAGFLRRYWHGNIRTAVIVAWMAVAPALTLVVQTYGGEGRFRVYLFGLPWFAMGVAWLFFAARGITRRAAVGLGVTLVSLTALFVGVYFQPEQENHVSAAEVTAARWLDQQLETNDAVVQVTFTFPGLIGANYSVLRTDPGQTASMAEWRQYTSRVTPEEVKEFVYATAYLNQVFVVFSDAQQTEAEVRGYFEPGELEVLETDIVRDNDFREIYNSGEVRIYQLEF